MPIKPPNPVYLGPPDKRSAGSNKPIRRVVIHSTVSPCEPGGARNIAAYFRSDNAGGSAHYITDPEETVQSAFDSVIAWHAPPNPHTLGIEMCDMPGPVPNDPPGSARWKALRRSWRWVRPNQRKMLARTARLTAHLCLAYNVPIDFLTVEELRKGGQDGARGITTHANTSLAYGQSTHWDPGFWPRRRFMRLVRRHADRLRAQARP
jgi:hypothetical protein